MRTYWTNKWMYLHELFHDHCGRSAPSEPLKSPSPSWVGDAASCLGHPPGHYCYLWTKAERDSREITGPRARRLISAALAVPRQWVWASQVCLPWPPPRHHLIYINWIEWSQTSFPWTEICKTPAEEDHQLLVLRGSFLMHVCVTYKQQGPRSVNTEQM